MSDEVRGEQIDATDEMSDRLSVRFRSLAIVLSVGAVLALAAWALFAVPALAAFTGWCLLAVALLLAGPPARSVPSSPNRVKTQRSIWPDGSMRLVVDALDDPCFLTDGSGIVRYQNKAATGRFGTARPGDPLSFKLRVPELLSAVDRAARGERLETVRFSERVPTERLYAATVTPIRVPRRDGKPRDIADFVLVRLNDETELMRTDRMRSDFIANASHELRTPLASLMGFVETLLGPAKNDSVNRERFLKIMLDQAHRMARLIDDLLSLSRIEMKAHLQPDTPVDLGLVVAHVAEILSPIALEAGVTLTKDLTEEAAIVRGDRDELIQLVTNLVENAIKYGRSGGHVRLALHPEAGTDGQSGVAITVADDGPGIAAQHLPRLTERFYRADAETSKRQKGTGLGLAIVKHIVNRHRGRMTIRSTVGEGTTVSVQLDRTLG